MQKTSIYETLINLLNEHVGAIDLKQADSLSPIFEQIGNARLVLMGEASHGTDEFYRTRMALSKRLITEKGFHAIAIEGDWPSAYPVHCYLQGDGAANDALAALADFKRFPQWMWRNTVVLEFLQWLRQYNDTTAKKVGFYGMDLYSLHESMQAVIEYLKRHDPFAADKAIERYHCFDHVATDPQNYGYLVKQHLKKTCYERVKQQLMELQRGRFQQLNKNSLNKNEALYIATQNARVVKNAEHYYRAMFEPRAITWNIRDQHMLETISNLMTHLETVQQTPAKIIIWAHNSHIGDARVTEMQDRGEINLGQLLREQFEETTYLLGFSTAIGNVRAATKWDASSEAKVINAPLKGSYEALFHDTAIDNWFLNLHDPSHLTTLLQQPALQRAIGVIYRPETERISHYFFSRLAYQFDGLIHFDSSHALTTLDETIRPVREETEAYK